MGQQGAEQIEELTMGGHEAVVAQTDEKKLKLEQEELKERLEKLKLNWLDGLHAFFTAVVFLSVAFSDVGLQRCLFPHASHDTMELLKNMPLGMSFLSSFVFMIFPTTRHGIGFSNPNNSSTTSKKVGPGDVEAPAPQASHFANSITSPISHLEHHNVCEGEEVDERSIGE
uniref:Uncharacterized protein n=1 Tax=Oryza brachyantha TaxID=4533 RepID=J3L037_ORYBR